MRSTAGLRLTLALLTGVSALVAPAPLAAQQEECDWLAPTSNLTRREFGASVMVRVQDAHLRCRDGTVIRADSARLYENEEYYQLLGNVRYDTPEQRLTGQIVRYWRGQGQLQAREDVTLLRKSDGTRVTGQELDYFQSGPTRPDDLLEVQGGRPHATFYPAGEEGLGSGAETDQEPFELDADRILVRGRNVLHATGNVEVHREGLDAFSDQLDYDTSVGDLVLRNQARMVTPRYELEGDTIRGLMAEGELRDLLAIDRAILTGEDLNLAAPRISLFLPEGALERLVARRAPEPEGGPAPGLEEEVEEPVDPFELEHPPRPVARAEDFLMTADSIDVRAPDEVLERLMAVGGARAESTSRDSLNTEATPAVARRDWIEGDTIIATFSRVVEDGEDVAEAMAAAPADERPDSLPVEVAIPVDGVTDQAPDTARDEYRLERLVARVGARSLYRLTPTDTADVAERPEGELPRLALHYVTGDEITIILDQGEIDRMEVVGQTEGLHLEPVAPDGPPPDTAAGPPAGVATPGTTGVVRPRSRPHAATGPAGSPPGLPGPIPPAREPRR